MKKIEVENGKKKELMHLCNATYPTVRAALRFRSDTHLAKKIRNMALAMGGVLMEKIN